MEKLTSQLPDDKPLNEKVLRASQNYFRALQYLNRTGLWQSAAKQRQCWENATFSADSIKGVCGSRKCALCAPRYWRKRANSIYKRIRTSEQTTWLTITVPPEDRDWHQPYSLPANMKRLRTALFKMLPPHAQVFIVPHLTGHTPNKYHPHYNVLILNCVIDYASIRNQSLVALDLPRETDVHIVRVPHRELERTLHYIVRAEPDPIDRWRFTPEGVRLTSLERNDRPLVEEKKVKRKLRLRAVADINRQEEVSNDAAYDLSNRLRNGCVRHTKPTSAVRKMLTGIRGGVIAWLHPRGTDFGPDAREASSSLRRSPLVGKGDAPARGNTPKPNGTEMSSLTAARPRPGQSRFIPRGGRLSSLRARFLF